MTPKKKNTKNDLVSKTDPVFQVEFSDLKRTNLSCPCVWEGKCVKGKAVKITFRCGKLMIYYKDTFVLQDAKDDFDISAYLSDEELLVILKRNNLIKE
jgi:hypothetical protein